MRIHKMQRVNGCFFWLSLPIKQSNLNLDSENKTLAHQCKILCPTLLAAVVFLQQQTHRNLDQGLRSVISFTWIYISKSWNKFQI